MSLVRDPNNIPIFADAAVYVANVASPTQPTTISTAFGSSWDNLGVLDGDKGITDLREWAETEHFGWGIGLYRLGRKNYKETRTVTCLEKNSTTELIAHGGASSSSNVFVNRPTRRFLGFEYIDDSGNKERWFTTQAADLWIPNLDRNESDPSGRAITARIFADGSGKLYTRQWTGISQQVTVANATGGTFSLTYQGQTAAGITYSALPAAVQTALEGLSTIGTGNVTVTGTAGNYTITKLEYTLSGDGTSLTGTSPTLTITRT